MAGDQDVEILVHIEAPSKATDDALYRSLAASYTQFRPTSRIVIGPSHAVTRPPTDPLALSRPLPASIRPEASQAEVTASFRSFGSTNLSFQSVWENQSPRLLVENERSRGPAVAASPGPNTQTSWQQPPSVIDDSNPDNDVRLASYCSPTRVLESYLRNSGRQLPSTPAVASNDDRLPAPTPSLEGGHVISGTSSSSQSLRPQLEPVITGHDTLEVIPSSLPHSTEVIPSSPPRSPSLEEARRGRSLPQTPLRKRRFPASPRADSEPPSTKRLRKDVAARLPLTRSTSDIGPSKAQEPGPQQNIASDAHILLTEIRPPPAPVAVMDLDPTNVLTEPLAKMARDLDMASRFRPVLQTRELQPFERGYWLVECSNWGDDLPQKAWGFLCNYIRGGAAGWGVWCRRDEDWAWIRVYCWGSIVGHIYLLLYLASRRQIKSTGGKWIAGDGETIVTMGRSKS